MPIVLRLYGSTTQIKDIKGQAKVKQRSAKEEKKKPENSIMAATVYWSLLKVYLL